jgi:hypothetical protein
MLGPIWQLIHNKSVANSVLLEISYKLATKRVIANPRFSCSEISVPWGSLWIHLAQKMFLMFNCFYNFQRAYFFYLNLNFSSNCQRCSSSFGHTSRLWKLNWCHYYIYLRNECLWFSKVYSRSISDTYNK